MNVETGAIIHADYDGLSCELSERIGLLAEVARRGRPEIVEDVSPLVMLAIPLPSTKKGPKLVAVGVFPQLQIEHEHQVAAAAQIFGVDASRVLRWILGREIWSPRVLLHLATAIRDSFVQQDEVTRLRSEMNDAIDHACDAYTELGLLHRLTRHLALSENESELWQNALAWLSGSIQSQSLAIVANQAVEDYELTDLFTDDIDGVWIYGESPLEAVVLRELIERIGTPALSQPLILSQEQTSLPTWHCPEVRELVCVPINGGEQPLAWLLAINHRSQAYGTPDEFDSVDLRLLSSVGTILGIHSRNLGLYREQSELFSGLVLSMTSAIDAKDRYTSGHSHRVANLSVALAKQIGLEKKTLDTIYLGGLLHDVGKIGIDDHVLNKPGQLTDEEFEHIKQHSQFGYDILCGIRQLDNILPIVLHHHENWDGNGYPHGLTGTEIPLMARIVAVADAFDAMSGDRPYRKGMPYEKVDTILKNGAGMQWDTRVIDAFFAIREDVQNLYSDTSSQEASQKKVLTVN